MNPLNWFGKKLPKRTLTEKVDNIEAMVSELTDAVGKIHVDMWDKLTALEEQGRARPSIVLGMPTENGAEITMLEPLEGLEPLEEVSNDGE